METRTGCTTSAFQFMARNQLSFVCNCIRPATLPPPTLLLYANSANGGSRSAEQPDVTSVSSALLTAIDPLPLLLQAERALQAHLGSSSYATEVPPQL